MRLTASNLMNLENKPLNKMPIREPYHKNQVIEMERSPPRGKSTKLKQLGHDLYQPPSQLRQEQPQAV